jgi:hypothetical protein
MSASLEQRIATALADPELGSESLARLIAEVEEAAQQADAAAAKARSDALDPAVVIDAAKVGAEVATAELRRDRLNAALPKLREAHQQAGERDYALAWWADFEATQGELNALAAELAKVYPDCVQRLVGILERIPAMNARVDRVNLRAPGGVGDRLESVEQLARGVSGFGPNGLLSLTTELKLPKFTFGDDGDRYQYAWPPPQPSLAAQMAGLIAAPQGGVYGPDWHEKIKERDRQIVAEAERAAAESEARQREREKREKAEIEALRESERQRVLAAMHPGAR